jgi:spermidine/putrescine transport system ATP-binding protein
MLKIINIHKKFSSQTVLSGIDLEIQDGEFFSLLGPSGCGKTTLLRIIAGLESATSGEMYFDQQRLDTCGPQKRPFNMVFQRYALFPHLTVFDNVAFGLRIKGVELNSLKSRVEESLKQVGLWELKDRKPETLSGGQQQRVALARAVVNRPKMLLLDEPLSALDKKMREHMQLELRNIQKQVGITFIFVTHDQEEALALSDRIAVMHQGRLEQVSSAKLLYGRPETLFVAQFVGDSGAISGEASPIKHAAYNTELKFAENLNIKGIGNITNKTDAIAIVRPENVRLDLRLDIVDAQDNENILRGKIIANTFKSHFTEIQVVTVNNQILKSHIKEQDYPASFMLGQNVLLRFNSNDTFIFAKN